jgi:hypothetical protein
VNRFTKILLPGMAVAVFLAVPAPASDTTSAIQPSIHAGGALQAGEIVRGWDAASQNSSDHSVSHVWQQRLYMQLTFEATIQQRARILVGGEGSMLFSWAKQQEEYEAEVANFSFYPNDVECRYAFLGDPANPLLEATVGYFPYKYNPDVRNLGEYLYRTGTYPGYIINEFDYPQNRLEGIKVSSNLFNCIHQDFMLTSETNVVPLQDWGISYLADINPHPVIDFGVGVFFSHLFSVNESYTTPRNSNNVMDVKFKDTVHVADSLSPYFPYYLEYDTTYYTYKGIKLMARFSFDPKPLFPSGIFGKNDLRLYAEAAIIGLENYKTYYDTLWQRIPIMVGINLPTFKLLDVLALEVEWYGSRWPNNYYYMYHLDNRPQPYVDPLTSGVIDYAKDDNLKWSVYARRELAGCFTITGQVANDHARLTRFKPTYNLNEEVLRKPNDWWFILKLGYSF